MKHAVSTLEGALLDAAVAKAEGWTRQRPVINGKRCEECWWPPAYGDPEDPGPGANAGSAPLFSRSWGSGGPLIEREGITVVPSLIEWDASLKKHARKGFRAMFDVGCAHGGDLDGDHCQDGRTYLIAAMRAFVTSKLGEEVELP